MSKSIGRNVHRNVYVAKGYEVRVDVPVSTLLRINRKSAGNLVRCSYGIKTKERRGHIRVSDLRFNSNMPDIPVPSRGPIKFVLDYPLGKKYVGIIPAKMYNRMFRTIQIGELCWLVAQAYKKIYATTVMKKIGEVSPKKWKATFRDNSISVGDKNPWGIWGHSIDDLVIEGFVWIPKTKMFYVYIGS